MRARSFGVSFAANVEHGDALFGAADVLRGAQRNKKARTLAVCDDAAHPKRVIQQVDSVAHLQVPLLRHDVVGDGFVGRFELPAGAIEKTSAEPIKFLVVDSVDHHQILRVGENHSGSNFVDTGQFADLFAEAFLHDGAGEGKENRGVGRLDEDISADAFDTLSPFGKYSRGEADNHEHQDDLDGNGDNAEQAAQRPRHNAAEQHFQQGKRSVVSVGHREKLADNCNIFVFLGAKCVAEMEHEWCRSAGAIFQFRKDFNTSVDKFVEIAAREPANLLFFNRLDRFAPFPCNGQRTSMRAKLSTKEFPAGRKIYWHAVWSRREEKAG